MRKFALITGASGGIGRAIALKLAEDGYSLYLHYNANAAGIRSLISELDPFGGDYIPIQADLSTREGSRLIAENVFSIDAVIHNAGYSIYGMLEDLNENDAEKLVQTHITSPMLLTKTLLPKMVQKKQGSILFVSSIWGQTGAACEVAYSAVKGAQIAFAKALSKEVAPSNIRVNAIAPGAIDTVMLESFSSEEKAELKADIPLGRFGAPENIADGVSFLLSEKASYITGQVLSINGGWYI